MPEILISPENSFKRIQQLADRLTEIAKEAESIISELNSMQITYEIKRP